MKILEEFWYGNIEPTDYDTSSCKEYKKLQELIRRHQIRTHCEPGVDIVFLEGMDSIAAHPPFCSG